MQKQIGSVSLFILLKKIQHVYLDFIFPPQYLTASHKIVNNFTDYTNDKEVISFWRCTELYQMLQLAQQGGVVSYHTAIAWLQGRRVIGFHFNWRFQTASASSSHTAQ